VPLGPTVRRRRLGAELRRLREAHSLKLEEVAERLGLAPSTLSRIETGKAPTKSAYLTAMLEMYEVEDPGARKVLVDMAREGHRKGWWSIYDDVLPSGFDIYVGLEAEASGLRSYESDVIHGLLQTTDYALTVLRELRPKDTEEQIRRAVAYTESPGGMIYLEKDRDVRSCAEAFDRMRAAALSPGASVELIKQVLDGLT
jgi:transcriptional regulator with XRE-family HTH domain